jgi:hypothetical protein
MRRIKFVVNGGIDPGITIPIFEKGVTENAGVSRCPTG